MRSYSACTQKEDQGRKGRIRSAINTAVHASRATVSRLLPLYAAMTATASPASAEYMLAVAWRIAGKVMAVHSTKKI